MQEIRGQPRNSQLIAAAIEHCQREADTYFSRQVQKNLRERAEQMLPEGNKKIIRLLVKELTGDDSAARTPEEAAVDHRVRLCIESDGELLDDLRKQKGNNATIKKEK